MARAQWFQHTCKFPNDVLDGGGRLRAAHLCALEPSPWPGCWHHQSLNVFAQFGGGDEERKIWEEQPALLFWTRSPANETGSSWQHDLYSSNCKHQTYCYTSSASAATSLKHGPNLPRQKHLASGGGAFSGPQTRALVRARSNWRSVSPCACGCARAASVTCPAAHRSNSHAGRWQLIPTHIQDAACGTRPSCQDTVSATLNSGPWFGLSPCGLHALYTDPGAPGRRGPCKHPPTGSRRHSVQQTV